MLPEGLLKEGQEAMQQGGAKTTQHHLRGQEAGGHQAEWVEYDYLLISVKATFFDLTILPLGVYPKEILRTEAWILCTKITVCLIASVMSDSVQPHGL